MSATELSVATRETEAALDEVISRLNLNARDRAALRDVIAKLFDTSWRLAEAAVTERYVERGRKALPVIEDILDDFMPLDLVADMKATLRNALTEPT